MHCFMCMFYVVYVCTALPPRHDQPQRRSLFRDVIESLKIRSQLPEKIAQNFENNLAHNYERYGLDNEPPTLPSDIEFLPRRNDRVEMPSLKYRYPKSVDIDDQSDTTAQPKEVVVYIDTNKEKSTTAKPIKRTPQRRTRPPMKHKVNNDINQYNQDNEQNPEETEEPQSVIPLTNTMAGFSHLGNRESQIVVKPTVIVNIRGSVTHRDSDIRLEGRNNEVNSTKDEYPDIPQNVFNINQEIKLERTFAGQEGREKPKKDQIKDININLGDRAKIEDFDMMMCETATWSSNKEKKREGRNLFQILFSL